MNKLILPVLAVLALCSCNKDPDVNAPESPTTTPDTTMPPTGEEGTTSPEEMGGDTTAPDSDMATDAAMGDAG